MIKKNNYRFFTNGEWILITAAADSSRQINHWWHAAQWCSYRLQCSFWNCSRRQCGGNQTDNSGLTFHAVVVDGVVAVFRFPSALPKTRFSPPWCLHEWRAFVLCCIRNENWLQTQTQTQKLLRLSTLRNTNQSRFLSNWRTVMQDMNGFPSNLFVHSSFCSFCASPASSWTLHCLRTAPKNTIKVIRDKYTVEPLIHYQSRDSILQCIVSFYTIQKSEWTGWRHCRNRVTWLGFYCEVSFYTIQKSEWTVWRHCRNRVMWLKIWEVLLYL